MGGRIPILMGPDLKLLELSEITTVFSDFWIKASGVLTRKASNIFWYSTKEAKLLRF